MTQLSSFHGGLHLAGHKTLSTSQPIATLPIPARLVIPLNQHIGAAGELLVAVGDHVLKGQALTKPVGYVSASVHATSSGTISDIGEYPLPHPSGLSARCVVIDTDGKDEWLPHQGEPSYRLLHAAEIRNRVRHAGVVGLGGATFPTSVKMNPAGQIIDTLIINGAECEPYITCDDMLMRERAKEVILGADILLHALGTAHCIIAIEDNKPDAIAALRAALKAAADDTQLGDIAVIAVPTLYPTGGEKQLIKVLTGKEVPSHGLPAEIGLVMQNVATAAAVYRAICCGEPLISRVVTVTGEAVAHPQNLEVRIGTPISQLIEHCGGYLPANPLPLSARADGSPSPQKGAGRPVSQGDTLIMANRLIMGGPMMGFALQSDELPVTKGCNCLLIQNVPAASAAMPCIRCGECVTVCPASLLPQQLYWHASSKNFDQVQDYHLFDCIECGCCSQVCPSHIPLVQYFRFAKTEIWHQETEKRKADHARVRHDFRSERLEREKREREEALRKKKELLAQKAAAETTSGEDDPKKAAIAAAMERVKAKKEQSESAADSAPGKNA
ncbi:MAG: electron transport complex subunit RsxC [Gammaproteobacteria bacterium]|nr:electron transport complex subunit RsxC [Gammaproteobacteria bacterium]